MFAKPINLALVYIVTTFNVIVLASPLLALSTPFIEFENHHLIIDKGVFDKGTFLMFSLLFVASFFMLFYLLVDFLFGFSVRSSLKGCVRFEKIKDYDFLTDLFDQVKTKFGEKNVKLYVKSSDEINAYAVSSMGSKAIVLTRGLINHYLVESDDPKVFLYGLRSVIGHEMSHLINKDFLPTFLIITNQRVTNFISGTLYVVFSTAARVVSSLPYGGRFSSQMMTDVYSILNFFITMFNRFVVYNIYEILRRFVSRSIEYRCDRQSAKAFGGHNMALALSMLGESGYFTLFSTHPGTKARMKKVETIKITDSVIRPSFIDSLANYFSLLLLMVLCLYFAKQAHVDVFIRQYIENHEAIHAKLVALWRLVSGFLN